MEKQYPYTRREAVFDEYFEHKVSSNYSWLELKTDEVKDWISSQNMLTRTFLDSNVVVKEDFKSRLESLENYETRSSIFEIKGDLFFYKNNGLQNHDVLYRKRSDSDLEEVFLDPSTFSDDGSISLAGINFSVDNKYFAYRTSDSGSDWNELKVLDINTGDIIDDKVKYLKFSGVVFSGDGFYYSGWLDIKDGKIEVTDKKTKLYYHKLGTEQSEDIVIYDNLYNIEGSYFVSSTEDDRFLLLYITGSTNSGSLVVKDLEKDSDFYLISSEKDLSIGIVGNIGERLYMITNKNASNNKLVSFKLSENIIFEDVILEIDDLLEDVSVLENKLIVRYMNNVSSKIFVSNLDGVFETELSLPDKGVVDYIYSEFNEDYIYYSFTSYLYPNSIYKYNIATKKSELIFKADIDFNFEEYIVKQEDYKSKDGTIIPMFIVHNKYLKLDANNPTILYGYGGFNISATPNFSTSLLVFLEKGGIYAEPSIRGGEEFGEKWHKAGTKLNKQNVFDDFIYAAKYLISNKYTSSEKLVINGRSNGGLLIAACSNQEPNLFKVAIPEVGVMDMLEYHKFTAGIYWTEEYGSSEESEKDFLNLLSYSPIHNIKNVRYPATLVLTSDHDDRVVPSHSFKYIATLQNEAKKENPYLIRVEEDAGHGEGLSLSKKIDKWADIYTFIFMNM